jgi:hypothetical protein
MGSKIELTAPQLKRRLRQLGDPGHKKGQQNFFKEPVKFLGVNAPKVRALASEAVKEYRRAKLSFDEILAIADRLWAGAFVEERILGVVILSKFQRHFERRHWKHFDGWIDSLSN